MTYNKKFWVVYLILVVIPLLLIFSPSVTGLLKLSDDQNKSISYALLIVAILTPAYIIYKNLLGPKNKFWIVFPLVTVFILLLLLYSAYSISHFGF